MPRLEGTQTNPAIYVIVLVVLAVIAVLVLEFAGVINLIPSFGAA
jgi:hypothetical protein